MHHSNENKITRVLIERVIYFIQNMTIIIKTRKSSKIIKIFLSFELELKLELEIDFELKLELEIEFQFEFKFKL